jgi:FkbM family methyltransferase
LLPLFARFNPGDIRIKHHYTRDKILLHSFKHKGYWFHGKKREAETMKLFSRLIRPGDTVFDIGGHIGYMALYFSRLAGESGKVFVFEPGKNNLRYLEQNTRGKQNIVLVPKGAGNTDGKLEFFLEDLTGQNNSFIDHYHVLDENAKQAFFHPNVSADSVEVVRLDSFVALGDISPNFIKIDVEGFELEVLLGMEHVLDAHHPLLMIEVTRNKKVLYGLLQKHGYECYDSSMKKVADFTQISLNTFCFSTEFHKNLLETIR